MSYANDQTYIYIYHTKLIEKHKQTFRLEIQYIYIYFSNYNLLTPFVITWIFFLICISKGGNVHYLLITN